MSTNLVTPYKYAKLCGTTQQAIYNRINRGTLDVVIIKDATGEEKRYIDVVKNPPIKKE